MAAAAAPAAAPASLGSAKHNHFSFTSKQTDVRMSNIIAAKAVSDAIRTSLGPKGMDKMIQSQDGGVIITNDGATIMSHMQVFHPTAKMLVELSSAQDVEAGDGTTSVVVLAGSLLNACQGLLEKGIHPTSISEAFQMAQIKAEEILKSVSHPVSLTERAELIKAATTSMSSKVISSNSDFLAPLAVDAVLSITDANQQLGDESTVTLDSGAAESSVDLGNVRVTKAVGGTIDDTELVHGLAFARRVSHVAGAPTKVSGAKVGLIQFCLSAPKTDMDNSVIVSDYTQMDAILREERKYILDMCKKIKKSGCNVLLVQKSVLRDAVNDLSLHYLAKMKIMVIRDVERDEIEFVTKTLGCTPVAHPDALTADKLGHAELAQEVPVSGGMRVLKITGVANPGRTVSLLVRGSNKLVVEETERSIHDALCVVRSIVKKRALIIGGGAPEIEMALGLAEWAKTLTGPQQYAVRAYAEAMEIIPYTLAENAGLNPIKVVTELRRRHVSGERSAGINVRKGVISDMAAENVVQPLLVSTSAMNLATETVRMILKVDDLVPSA